MGFWGNVGNAVGGWFGGGSSTPSPSPSAPSSPAPSSPSQSSAPSSSSGGSSTPSSGFSGKVEESFTDSSGNTTQQGTSYLVGGQVVATIKAPSTGRTASQRAGENAEPRALYNGSPNTEYNLTLATGEQVKINQNQILSGAPSSNVTLANQIEKANAETPLGTPKVEEKSKMSKIWGTTKDVTGALFSPLGAVWLESFGRPTSTSASEFKKDFATAILRSSITPSPGGFIDESYKEAKKLRTSGEQTLAEQKVQSEQIEIIVGELNTKAETFKKTTDNQAGAYEDYSKSVVSSVKALRDIGVETTTNDKGELTFSSKALKTNVSPIGWKVQESFKNKTTGELTWKNYAYGGAEVISKTAEAYVVGEVLAVSGVAGAFGRGASYIANTGKIGKTAIYGGGTLLTAYAIGEPTYSGYTLAKQNDLPGWFGATQGALVGTGEVLGFMGGASEGKLSPIKIQTAEIEGDIKAMSIGFENPLNPKGKFYPIATRNMQTYVALGDEGLLFQEGKVLRAGELVTKTKWDLGWGKPDNLNWIPETKAGRFEPMSKFEAGYLKANMGEQTIRLATEELTQQKTLEITRDLYNVNIKGNPQIDFGKSRAFKELSPEGQKAFKEFYLGQAKGQTGLKGFWNAVSNKGLERIYGSSTIEAEGGFKTNVMRNKGEYGDFDLVYRDSAQDKANILKDLLQKSGQKVRVMKDTSLVEIQTKDGEWIHLADIHGADMPDLMLKGAPYGFELRSPKSFSINEGNVMTKGSRLSDSLVGKMGSTLSVSRSPKGALIFSPEEHRLKDVSDLISIADRLNEVKVIGKDAKNFAKWGELGVDSTGEKIIQLKNLLKVNFPEVRFDASDTTLLFNAPSKPMNIPGFGGVGNLWAVNPKFETTKSESYKRTDAMIKAFMPKEVAQGEKMIRKATLEAFAPEKVPSKSPSVNLKDLIKFDWGSKTPKSFEQSPSLSWSPSPVPSPSPSWSPSPSPSVSPSQSVSWSPSPSPSQYPSPSPSRSPSRSPSQSPSRSPSPSPSWVEPTPFIMPNLLPGGGWANPLPKKSPQRTQKSSTYIPDFTAKILGVESEPISKAQLKKLLKQSFSGLEVRPSLVFKETKVKGWK